MRKLDCYPFCRIKAVSSGLAVLMLAALVVSALGCHRRVAASAEKGVEVEVLRLGFDPAAGTPVVILREKTGERMLPIWIGEPEAQAILLKLHGIEPLRPLTSDLLKAVLDTTGNRVDRIVINDLRDQTFYATIYLDHARYRIDSRPSDAIALALACKAPIFVLPRLFMTQVPEQRQRQKPGIVLPQTRVRLGDKIAALLNAGAPCRAGATGAAS
jgi:bifunctional DNase/RNase